MKIWYALILLILLLVVSALPAAAAPAEPEAIPPGVRVLTMADNGTTVVMRRGQVFVIDLSPYSSVDPSRAAWRLLDRPANGIWVAWQDGTVSGTYDPVCRHQNPRCGQVTVAWGVTLDMR